MALKCVVVDKNNNVLSDEELANKIIVSSRYYDVVLPIRKKINDDIFRQNKK